MSEIDALSFGSTVDMLSNSLQGASMNQSQIANNIANVNTPNFRSSNVSFKDALAQAAGAAPDPDALGMKVDDTRQYALDDGGSPMPFAPQLRVDETSRMRVDGNNVDVDQEMAQLSQNSAYAQTMTQLLQTQFARLREAITEQPR